MKQAFSQQSTEHNDALCVSLKDHSPGPNAWTCRYEAERKIWVFRKAHKLPCIKKQA